MGTVLEFSKQVLSELEPGLPELRSVEDSDRREEMAGRHICQLRFDSVARKMFGHNSFEVSQTPV